jgi:hypothetical protein
MKSAVLAAALMFAGIVAIGVANVSPHDWAEEAYYHADIQFRLGDYDRARERCESALFWNRRHLSAKALLAAIDIYQGRAPAIEADAYMAARIKEMDTAFARVEAGAPRKAELERVLDIATWLPWTEDVLNRVLRARRRLHEAGGCRISGPAVSAGSASRAGPSRLPSP